MNWGNLGSMHLSDYCHAGSGCLLGKGLGVTTGTWLNKWGCIILCPPFLLHLPPPPHPPGSDMWYSAVLQKKGLFHAWTILSTPPKWHSDTHWVSDNPPGPPPLTHSHTQNSLCLSSEEKKNSLTSHCNLKGREREIRARRRRDCVRWSCSCELSSSTSWALTLYHTASTERQLGGSLKDR